MSLSGADFLYKKVDEGAFKHLVLNCIINRDVCRKTYLIGAFIHVLNPFLV